MCDKDSVEIVNVSLERRKAKSEQQNVSKSKCMDTDTGGAKWLKKRNSEKKVDKKSKTKVSEKEEQELIQEEIDKILNYTDPNELFGIMPSDEKLGEEGTAADKPEAAEKVKVELEEEESIAKLAGIVITEEKKASQEDCLKNWMERRLKDEKNV